MAHKNTRKRRMVEVDSPEEPEYDEPSDKSSMTPDTTDRKKATHLRCERQRREAINSGYQELKELLPSSFTNLGCKTTNASVLFRAAEHIRRLHTQRDSQTSQLRRHKAELSAVQVISEQYERLNDKEVPVGDGRAPKECARLDHLHETMDRLFESFEGQVDGTDYASLARTLLTWLEATDVPGAFRGD